MPPPTYQSFFVTQFNTHYARNNKSRWQKNLRCFPSCNQAGHCSTGFCGGEVKAQCHIQQPSCASFAELSYASFGDFVEHNSNMCRDTENRVLASHMDSLSRSDTQATALLLKSSTTRKVVLMLEALN